MSKKVIAYTIIYDDEQRDEVKGKVKEILKDNPNMSNRELAKRTGVSHPTIASYKCELFNNNGQ